MNELDLQLRRCLSRSKVFHLYGGRNEVAGGEMAADDSSVIPAHP